MLAMSLLRGAIRRAILFPTRTHQGAAPDRWMCTPASREARCGHHCGSPLTKVGAEEFSPTGHRGRLKFSKLRVLALAARLALLAHRSPLPRSARAERGRGNFGGCRSIFQNWVAHTGYGCLMAPRDTSPEVHAAQIAAYRRMGSAARARLAEDMSSATRRLAADGIRSRHPEYTDREVRFALCRLLYGDDLFERAWPRSPLLPP